MRNIKLMISIFSPIALIIIGLYLFLFFRGGIAFNFGKIEYAETTAECVSVGHSTEKGLDRSREGKPNEKDKYHIIYDYSYRVNGITYQASDRDTRELDDYQSYEKDIEESQNRIGYTKTIYYNPDKPEQYSFSYKNFHESVSSTNRVIGIIFGLCVVIALPQIALTVALPNIRRKRRKR